jgi:hypothetical protein
MKILLPLIITCGLVARAHAADENRFYKVPLEEHGGKLLANYAANAPWFQAPQGEQVFGGVPFDPLTKVQVHGNVDFRDGRVYPTRVTGIPVGKRAARLHVIQGSSGSEQDGRPLAAMKVHYAGGKSHTFFFTVGENTRDWWKRRGESNSSLSDPNTKVIWTGSSDDSAKIGATHRLFKTSFDLPVMDQPVESIDLFSLFSQASFEVLALTVEAPGPDVKRGTPLPSADDSLYRDQVTIEAINQAGERLPGAVVRGNVLDSNGNAIFAWRSSETLSDPGVVPADFPAKAASLRLIVSATDYAPGNLELKPDAERHFPKQMQVQLEPGVRISGLVTSSDGSPVNKAKVEIMGRRKDANGKVTTFIYEDKNTDARGRWRMQAAPQRLENVVFKVTHKDYRAGSFDVSPGSASSGKNNVAGDALLSGQAAFQLSPGIMLTGVVEDEKGKRIENAQVTFISEQGSRTRASQPSDFEGRFTLGVKQGGPGHLVVEQTNCMPSAQQMTLTETSEPVKITLARGEPFSGRLLARPLTGPTNLAPLVGANVSLNSRENSFVRWSGITDGAGRFTWNHSPTGTLFVMPQQKGYIYHAFTAEHGKQTNDFILSAALSVSGHVVDAQTRRPIPSFTVIPGDSWNEDQINWRPERKIKGADGEFTLEDSNGGSSARLLAKVEAPGYWPQVLRPEGSGQQNVLIELKPGNPIKGLVKLPNGQPAAGAEIAVIGEGYVTLSRGQFKKQSYDIRQKLIVTSDTAGRFELPPTVSQRVLVVHEEGCAETTISNLLKEAEVNLRSFGIIEGTLMVGSKPGPNLEVKLNDNRNGGMGFDYDYADFDMKTDSEGKFRFTHVPPGQRWLIRLIPIDDSSRAWSHQTPISIEPGKVTKVTMGGTGRAVIGKVVPDDPTRNVNWSSGSRSLGTLQPKPPPFTTQEAYRAWSNSPEVKAASANYRYYGISFQSDGSFRADDIPAGKYELRLYFNEPRSRSSGSMGAQIGSITREFEIPAMAGGRSDEPLDLGTLTLVTRKTMAGR